MITLLADRMKLLTPTLSHILLVLGLTTFRQKFGIECAAVKNGTFNHPNFIVYFTESTLSTRFNDFEDYFPMIEKISSEFSQISCANKIIPMAVATRNKLLSTKNMSEGVYQKPLQVYLQHVSNFEKVNGPTFVETLRLADETNDIFPGTVKYLLAHYYLFDQDEFKRFWSFSGTRKRFIYMANSTHHTYKLGIAFPLDDCEKAIFKVNLDNVQLVAFVSRLIYKDKNNLSVEKSFNQLTRQFNLCAKTMKSISPKVEIALQTGFSDTNPKGKQDYSALVTFWEMVNDWAIKDNVKVFFFEAYDTPQLGNLKSKRGLWKLARKPRRYHTPDDFIFMDKRIGNSYKLSETAKNYDKLIEDLDFKHDNFVVAFNSSAISKYDGDDYYHHDDFLPIIRTIAAKFSSVCFVNYSPAVTEAVVIHNSMTMQSRNKSNSRSLWLYQMFEFDNEINLDHALHAAKMNNSFSPDTVKYLLFQDSDADTLLAYVTNEGESIINQVGLAIKLPLLDCLRGTRVRTQVSRLFSYVKLIIITMKTDQEDYDVGVEKTVIGLTKAFTKCKKKIESMSPGQSPKFAFSLDWSDTDSNSIQNYSNLVSFWGKINNWAKITKTTVFMTEAFDDVSNEGTYGWWRLAFKPIIYHTIAEYVYEDKTERRNRISNGVPVAPDNTSIKQDVGLGQEWKVTNSSFSRTNFIVQFDPITNEEHLRDGINEDQIHQIILKLFTRFSSICTAGLYKKDLLTDMSDGTLEVANYNMKSGLKNESRSLYLLFRVDVNDKAFGANQLALKMAKIANAIAAGSVEYFIAFIDHDSLNDVADHVKHFEKAKKWLTKETTTFFYKLGSIYSITACGHGTNVKKKIIPAIKVLDLIIFDAHADDRDYEVGVYESVQGFTKIFERCKKKISQLNSSTEVAFRTSWSDTTKYQRQGSIDLVLFWEKMNEWAESTKTKIFILEAFDTPDTDSIEDSRSGWWRLILKQPNNSSSELIFEEKRAIVLENLAKQGSVESNLRSVLISVLTALAITALSAISVFLFVYRRYKNKLAEAQEYILTKKEEEDFFEGAPGMQSSHSMDVRLGEELDVYLQKYDKDYEVERELFKFDETNILGSGEFGIVCKGTVTKCEEEIDVAVKTLKTTSSEAVKNLLTEIKVMIHLGKHENIVSIIGANTEGMRRGNVILFTELCAKGSLENYLRELRRQNITSEKTDNETQGNLRIDQNDEIKKLARYQNFESRSDSIEKLVTYVNGPHGLKQTENLLCRLSYEIANGMEFIVSKKVVHADLATRNVLLTNNLTAKISDFGLSRRLYNYTNYVKTQTQPLPWKWMSPESLRRWEFNEKTDVWAFGITLWEIYSLGDTPYPGLSWTADFSSELERGLRPQEPEFNTNSIYSVMLTCWNNDPNKRPSFLELKKILSK